MRRLLLAAAVFALGCSGDATSPVGGKVTLSATQASNLVAKATQIAAANSEMAWLADSINLVLSAGAEAPWISVKVDGVSKNYYAVAIARFITTGSKFSTFHVFAFNDASNPTDFIITNGYVAASAGGAAPTTVDASFGTINAFAHIVHLAGSTITDWKATTGTATFVAIDGGSFCPGSSAAANPICTRGEVGAIAEVTQARPDAVISDVHTASIGTGMVPGVVLTFH